MRIDEALIRYTDSRQIAGRRWLRRKLLLSAVPKLHGTSRRRSTPQNQPVRIHAKYRAVARRELRTSWIFFLASNGQARHATDLWASSTNLLEDWDSQDSPTAYRD